MLGKAAFQIRRQTDVKPFGINFALQPAFAALRHGIRFAALRHAWQANHAVAQRRRMVGEVGLEPTKA
jgi:hypothetical protein